MGGVIFFVVSIVISQLNGKSSQGGSGLSLGFMLSEPVCTMVKPIPPALVV